MQSKALTDILNALQEVAEDHRKVTLQHLVDKFRTRSKGPLLAVCGLLMMSPLAGVPGVPTLFATCSFLLAWKMLRGGGEVELPRRVGQLGLSQQKSKKVLTKVRPLVDRLEKWIHPRWRPLIEKYQGRKISALAVMVLALSVPPLEFLPLAALAPGLGIMLVGIAVTAHDGLLLLLSLFATSTCLGGGLWLASL